MKKHFATALLLLSAVGAYAQRGTCGTGITWQLNDKTLTISGTGKMKDFRGTGERPSYDIYKDNIERVVIESGITHVGDDAFYQYEHLKNVELPEGLRVIGMGAFENCSSITEIALPESTDSIMGYAFSRTGIESITLPVGLKLLDRAPFDGCSRLKTVYWNAENCNAHTSSHASPFAYWDYECQIETVVFGNSVRSVPARCFYDASTLKNIQTAGTISRIGEEAFEGTAWLNQHGVTEEGGITHINGEIVYIDKVLYQYFGTMTTPTVVNIPEGIESVTARAFAGRDMLVKVTIPSTMQFIGNGAFSTCQSLSEVEWNAKTCEDFSSMPFKDDVLAFLTLGPQVERIPAHFLDGSKAIQRITLPASVTEIGERAFANMPLLNKVEFSDGLQTIEGYAFYNLPQLSKVDLPDGLQTIKSHAFIECPKLLEITLPEGLKVLETAAFVNQSDQGYLTTVTWNAINCQRTAVSYGTQARGMGITNLLPSTVNSIMVGEKVESLPERAFERTGIAEIALPASLKNIEYGLFYDCAKLSLIAISEGTEEIGKNAFYGCKKLETLHLPATLHTISDQAFWNSGLKKMFIPANVKNIGEDLFRGCDQLTEIIMGGEPLATYKYVGSNADIYVNDVNGYKALEEWKYSTLKPLISFGDNRFTYSGTAPQTTYACNLPGYTTDYEMDALETNAGTYLSEKTARFTGEYDFTVRIPYSYTIDKAPLAVKATDTTRVYGDENPAWSYTTEGLVNGETAADAFSEEPVFTCAAEMKSNTGEYDIYLANSPKSANYSPQYSWGTLTIIPRPVQVSVEDATRPYGEENPEFTFAFEGLAEGDNAESVFPYRLPSTYTDAYWSSPVGDYEVTPYPASSSYNYDVTLSGGTLHVVPAQQSISWEQDIERINLGEEIELSAWASSGLDVAFEMDENECATLELAYGQYVLTGCKSGEVTIRATQAGDGNYLAAEPVEKTVYIYDPTSIASEAAQTGTAVGGKGCVIVKNAQPGSRVNLYGTDGRLLSSATFEGGTLRLETGQPGICIVDVNGKRLKVIVK